MMLRKLIRRAWSRRPGPAPLPPREGYDRWAIAYDRSPTQVQTLEAQARQELMPDVAGREVLDVGCGRGRATSSAREEGARRLVAADFSLAMLSRAAGAMERVACDVARLPLLPESFDVVICALVLGHVEDLDRALDSLARVLRPGGFLLLSDFHPFATLRGWQRSFFDEANGRHYEIEQHLHLLSEYVTGLGRSGLVLEALEEPRWRDFPVVFVLRARKT